MSTLSRLLQHQHDGYHKNPCNTSVLAVRPHNASAIHAFPLAIFRLAIGESPLNFFGKVGPW